MYEPEVNDYVIWTTALGMVHEGWVYFKAEPSELQSPKKGIKRGIRNRSIFLSMK